VECYPQGIYRPRDAQATALYHLVEDNFDELVRVWDERYEKQHGFWRPVIRHVVEQYLTCGDLRCGFARLRCPSCREDHLLPYSCKRRCFCPSCHQKRALLFAEHVDEEVLGQVPVRQYVVTIPKMLRLCFKYDRKLLGELSRCFYDSIKEIFLLAAPQAGDCSPGSPPLPAMICSVQTYGDDPTRFHPHVHCLAADGLLGPDGSFFPIPQPDPVQIMLLFRHRLLRSLLAQEKISDRLVEILLSWRHPGFSVFQGDSVSCDDHEVRERLARYMAHPPVGLYRLHYDPRTRGVTYASKNHDGCAGQDFSGTIAYPALDFLAALCTHIPDAGQQLIRYYGGWSHVRRARARKTGSPPARSAPAFDTRNGCASPSKRAWARLIKKVYEADPLLCRRCSRPLKIISLIDSASIIERILRHLKLWDRPERPPPASAPSTLYYDVDGC
jgi:hypothetical protein